MAEQPRHRSLQIADRAPALVSDEEVLRALLGMDPHRTPDQDELRAARTVAFVLSMEARATDLAGDGVARDAAGLADSCGLSESAAERSLALLEGAGVVETRRTRGHARLHIPDEAFVPHPPSARIDWVETRAALSGDAAATLVFRVLLDMLPRPDQWTVVSQRELAERARYSRGMVLRAIKALGERGAIEQDARSGQRSRYRLGGRVLGTADRRIHEPQLTGRPRPPAGVPEEAAGGVAPSPVAEQAPGGVTLTVGGARFRVEAGLEVCFVRHSEGGVVVRIGSSIEIGPIR